MTRINCIPVEELTDKHLMAEYFELPRVFTNLLKAMNNNTLHKALDNIPMKYTMGKGHMKFFYNKIYYLNGRYTDIFLELKERGFNIDPEKFGINSEKILKLPYCLYKDWKPTKEAMRINRERIKERMK